LSSSSHDTRPPTHDSAKLHAEATRRWDRLAGQHPELAETIAAGRGLVALYIDATPTRGGVALSVERAREKLRDGVSLLEGEDLDPDLPALRTFFARLCAWAGAQPALAADAARLAAASAAEPDLVETLLTAALLTDDAALEGQAARLAIAPERLQTQVGYLVSAALIGAARETEPLLREAAVPWEEPVCPICGGAPLLAELQGSSGERTLRCAGCGTGWRTLVNRCAHCGNTEGKALHYLAVEGRGEKYRVDLCDRCGGYLTSAASFAPTPRELLPIEDAATLHLAAAARERGYTATPRVEG
jgi:FdhE protein